MISEHPFVNCKNSTKSHITFELHRKDANDNWKPLKLEDCSKLEQDNWSQEGDDGYFEEDHDEGSDNNVY